MDQRITFSLLALILLSSSVVRLAPRWSSRNAISSDTYYHLYCARRIREAGYSLPASHPDLLLPHRYTYPFGYHFFLALFPDRLRHHVEWATGAVADSVSTYAAFAFTRFVLQEAAIPHVDAHALAISALYAFSPGLVRVGSGPRAYNGNARVVGQMLYLVHLTSAYWALRQGSVVALLTSVIAAALLLFTSCFSVQVYVLFGAGFAALVDPRYVLLSLAALFVSLLISGGRTWSVLSGNTRHSIFYYQHLQAAFLYPLVATWSRYRTNMSRAAAALRSGNILECIHIILDEKYPPHLALLVNPVAFLSMVLVVMAKASPPPLTFLAVWTGVSILSFIVTKTKPMLFLGEGERYLEASVLPALLIVPLTLGAQSWLPLSALGLHAAIATVHAQWRYRQFCRTSNADYERTEELFSHLRSLPRGPVLPLGSVHWQCAYRGGQPVVCYGGKIDSRDLPAAQFLRAFGNYPYPGDGFEDLLSEYNIRYIVAHAMSRDHYVDAILKSRRRFEDRVVPVMERGPLILYEVRRDPPRSVPV